MRRRRRFVDQREERAASARDIKDRGRMRREQGKTLVAGPAAIIACIREYLRRIRMSMMPGSQVTFSLRTSSFIRRGHRIQAKKLVRSITPQLTCGRIH